VTTRHALAILLLLVAAAAGRAAPGDSLTGTDMLAELAARRTALGERIGPGTLLLFAEPKEGIFFPRPEPNLLYLTGVDDPHAALVLTAECPEATARSREARRLADRLSALEGSLREVVGRAGRIRGVDRETAGSAVAALREAGRARARAEQVAREGRGPVRVRSTLYLASPNPRAALWDGPGLTADAAGARASGIEDGRGIGRLFGDLSASLPQGGRLWRLTRKDAGRANESRLERLLEERPDLVVRDALPELTALRTVKSKEEIARIRKACELTAAGLRECMRSCRPKMREHELQAILEYVCRRGGAVRQAFPSIVGAGPNGVILHYHENAGPVGNGDLVLMDVGAEYMGYAADVTRTFPANGRFTAEQARLYDIVLAAQRAGIEAVRPGATLGDVDRAARKVIADAGHGDAFLHGTSHHVGLDVHDPAAGGALAPGMVFTVEPGIYLRPDGPGIRIEDTVVVTRRGCEVLSDGVPRERAKIEALMREKGVGDARIK
jgi:Xaa-Pro aminopeptidase